MILWGERLGSFAPFFLMKNPQLGAFMVRKRKIYQILIVNNK